MPGCRGSVIQSKIRGHRDEWNYESGQGRGERQDRRCGRRRRRGRVYKMTTSYSNSNYESNERWYPCQTFVPNQE